MPMYSHSKLSTFEQCKLKYKYRYIDKIKPAIEKSIEAHLGTCVHHALEWLYVQKKEKNRVPELDAVIGVYVHKWKEEWSDTIVIVKSHLSAEHYMQKGLQFLIDYYGTHHPFEDGTMELEKRVFIKIGPEGEYTVQGFIDRLVYNRETGEYEIHDYKTSGTLPSKEKIETDRQLALYSIAIKELFGKDKEVTLNWHFLNFNQKITSRRTHEQLERLKGEIHSLIKEIEGTEEFPAQPSMLCNWCEFKPYCPAHGGTPPETKEEVNEIKKELIQERYPTLSKYLKD